MTDFIHEQPPEEKKPQTPPPEQPVSERERQKRVYAYIAVLFTAAFILILWSFLSTHRSNQEVIDQVKGSTSLMQSTIEENRALESEIDALEARVDELETSLDRAEEALDAAAEASARQEAVISALDRLRKLEGAFEAYQYETAKELVLAFEDNDLVQYLPDTPLHTEPDGNDAESPLATYERIRAKLFPDGMA